MKGIFKLIKGEFTKLLKSNTLYIMTGLLTAAIILMSVVYATQEQNVNSLLEFVVGGGPELDAFDIMDGGDGLNALKDAGIDTSELESFSQKLNERPQVKMLLIGTDPAILKALSSGSAPSTGMTDITQYAELSKIQTQLYGQYFHDLYDQSKFYDDLLANQSALIKQSGYGLTFNDIITHSLSSLNTAYLNLMGTDGAYAIYKQAATADNWNNLIVAARSFDKALTEYRYYIESTVMKTNYLLIATANMSSEAHTTLSDGVKALNTSALTQLSRYIGGVKDKDTVQNFLAEINTTPYPIPTVERNGDYSDLTPRKSEESDSPADESLKLRNIAYNLVSDLELLARSAESPDSLFYGYDSATVSQVKAHITSGTAPTKEVNDFVARFNVKPALKADGSLDMDPLKPFADAIEQSYTAEITEDIYNERIAPYYDNSEQAKLVALRAKLDLLTSKTAGEIFAISTAENPDPEQTAELNALYSDIKSTFREYTSRTGTVSTLVKNISWVEAIESNNLSDKQTKNIRGFLFNSRYKLNSSVTQAQFLIERDELSAQFTAPEKLTDGYGAVQFIYVLTGVIILIFGIVLAAGTIAGEHADGTMKLLLIRPHTRTQVLLSKFLTVALVLLGFYILNFLISLGIGAIFWGLKAPFTVLSIFNSTTAITMTPFAVLAWMHIFGLLEAVIFALIALTISTVARSRSGAIAVSMLIYFVSFVLGALLSTYGWYKFVVFNNTNLFMYMSSVGPALADLTLWFSLAVNLVYIVGLALACFFTFAKRDAT